MKRAVLVAAHYIDSPRRAGFHWIANALRRQGWHVTFVTVGFSQLSRLRPGSDHRFGYGILRQAGRPVELAPDLVSYVWFTLFHPLNRLPAIGNTLAAPLFRRYGSLPMPGIEPLVHAADLIIFESTSGLMLFDRFHAWAPRARFVYRMSDDLRLLRAHPVVLETEGRILPEFDLVSVPSSSMLARFAGHQNVMFHPHGIETAPFDEPNEDPYDRSRAGHAIFVGTAHLDRTFLDVAARDFPAWDFHVVGPFDSLPDRPNVLAHGELPFSETVPYIVHADVGLATLEHVPGAETLRDSLKVVQYTYARLPIVAPDFMASNRTNLFLYHPGDDASIRGAMTAAAQSDRSAISREGIWSWDDLARVLAGDGSQ